MTTLPIGLGLYPSGQPGDWGFTWTPTKPALPDGGGAPVLVMGIDGHERHELALAARQAGYDVTRRRFTDDQHQVDVTATVEANVDRWYGLGLGGLNPLSFLQHYHRVLAFNEQYAPSQRATWPFLAAIELGLCRRYHSVGIPYAWGSLAVGCVDPSDMVTTFAAINQEADAICYHGYAAPNNTDLEPPEIPWFARRPMMWWQALKSKGIVMPDLLLGESGTYYPWHATGIASESYMTLAGHISDMLYQWRTMGMGVIGHCVFAVDAQGDMGRQWNLDQTALQHARTWNLRSDLDRSIPPPRRHTMHVDYPNAVLDASPNFGYPKGTHGRNGYPIMAIVFHVEGGSETATDNEFDDPNSDLSTHYSSPKVGPIKQHVLAADAAYGCGIVNTPRLSNPVVAYAMQHGINPNLLCVQIEREGVPGEPLTENQYQNERALTSWLIAEYPTIQWLLGHDDWDTVNRAFCPGPNHPWARLWLDLRPLLIAHGVHMSHFQEDTLTPEQKRAVLDDLDFLWAYSNATETVKDPAASEKIIHERIVALKITLGLQ